MKPKSRMTDFRRFEGLMNRLLAVPHREIKAKLEGEKLRERRVAHSPFPSDLFRGLGLGAPSLHAQQGGVFS